jgi:hypothetical protein
VTFPYFLITELIIKILKTEIVYLNYAACKYPLNKTSSSTFGMKVALSGGYIVKYKEKYKPQETTIGASSSVNPTIFLVRCAPLSRQYFDKNKIKFSLSKYDIK